MSINYSKNSLVKELNLVEVVNSPCSQIMFTSRKGILLPFSFSIVKGMLTRREFNKWSWLPP